MDAVYTDRRDYWQRWQSNLQAEEQNYRTAVTQAKMSQLQLSRGSLLVAGGIYGGSALGVFQAGTYASQVRSWRFYPAAPALILGGHRTLILKQAEQYAYRMAAELPPYPAAGRQLPHVGPMKGADPDGGVVDNWFAGGGCGHMALAFKNMWPDLKIGAEIANNGDITHAWVHDGKHSHDVYGTHENSRSSQAPFYGARCT
jgi:hypothetical protein